MPERVADLIADLEKAREYEGPSFRGFRQAGLSSGAEWVLEKLKQLPRPASEMHRVYEEADDEFELIDLLSDHEIQDRGYKPTDKEPILVKGDSALRRDVIREYTSDEDLHEDVWIGEALTDMG
ncbi:MAG: hypothetical protein ACXW5U_00750 [Thermoanaerobaculia bacterium]